MKITVLSDTHRGFKKMKYVVDNNIDSDLFIHLGDGWHEFYDISSLHPDKEFIFVKGNTDFGNSKEERVVELPGCNIFCAHGHNLDVHTTLENLLDKASYHNCKVALYGHTHVFRTEFINGIYVMNPGSIESPRDKNPPTYGIIEINDKGGIIMNIIECSVNL